MTLKRCFSLFYGVLVLVIGIACSDSVLRFFYFFPEKNNLAIVTGIVEEFEDGNYRIKMKLKEGHEHFYYFSILGSKHKLLEKLKEYDNAGVELLTAKVNLGMFNYYSGNSFQSIYQVTVENEEVQTYGEVIVSVDKISWYFYIASLTLVIAGIFLSWKGIKPFYE